MSCVVVLFPLYIVSHLWHRIPPNFTVSYKLTTNHAFLNRLALYRYLIEMNTHALCERAYKPNANQPETPLFSNRKTARRAQHFRAVSVETSRLTVHSIFLTAHCQTQELEQGRFKSPFRISVAGNPRRTLGSAMLMIKIIN